MKHFELLALSVGSIFNFASVSSQTPTNFVIILMDDMGYGDVNVNGAIGYDTPNFNRLGNEGMIFTRYNVPQAVSGASRAGLLTGCYPNRFGFIGAPSPRVNHGIGDQEVTIAEMLHQKGYRCAIYGKWHLGHHKQFLPLHHGFDEFYGIPYSSDMWPYHPTKKFMPDLPLIEGDEIVGYNPDHARFTTDFTERAVDFIERNKKNPFFLYVAHPMPHVPLDVSDKFKGKSHQGLYGDVMMELDWSIGQILDKLKKEKLDDNTLLVVISDNGPWLNYGNHSGTTGGLREGKGTSFEGGQRVPCIMHWKGHIKPGTICNKLVSGIDIFPTFAAIAGAELPNHKIDGVDIRPLLNGEPGANPRTSFCYYYGKNLEAVTDGDYKLIFPHKHRSYEKYLPGKDGQPGEFEKDCLLKEKQLFDLRLDPGERYNVITQHPDIVIKLEKIAAEIREDIGDDLTQTTGKNVRPLGRVKETN